jgi:GSCFA family
MAGGMMTSDITADPSWGYNVIPRRKNNYPRMNSEFVDLPKLITDFISDKNASLIFDKNTKFLLQGSCFAENLYNELKSLGYPCYYNKVIEALNSPFANLAYLLGLKGNQSDPVHQEIEKADIYVLTIGVAPCWFSSANGQFVFRPDLRNINKYFQRTLTVNEAKDALLNVFELIYAINPKIKIVLTLSPVPLRSTFEFESAIVADCVSKSVLRAAIHEALLACKKQKPIYYPSFEIVRWAGAHVGDAFGEDGMPTHVSEKYVKQIIASFIGGAPSDAA